MAEKENKKEAAMIALQKIRERVKPQLPESADAVAGPIYSLNQASCLAYFGEKDAQQLAAIRRMTVDFDLPVEIVEVPTVREDDGLALSSRNRHLSPLERQIAPALYRALQEAARLIASGLTDAQQVKAKAVATLHPFPQLQVEYFEIVNPVDMQPVERIDGPVRVAAAAWLGTTRLIDNILAGAFT